MSVLLFGFARDYTLQRLRRNERIGRGFTRMHADSGLRVHSRKSAANLLGLFVEWARAGANLMMHHGDASIFAQTLRQDLEKIKATLQGARPRSAPAEIAV